MYLNIDWIFLHQSLNMLVNTCENRLQIKQLFQLILNSKMLGVKHLLKERRLEDPKRDANSLIKIPDSYDVVQNLICEYFGSFFA